MHVAMGLELDDPFQPKPFYSMIYFPFSTVLDA